MSVLLTRSFLGNSWLLGETIFLITIKAVILVLWTQEGVPDDSWGKLLYFVIH